MTTPTMRLPGSGELVGSPRLGVCVWSKTRRFNDDPDYASPVGGHIISIDTVTDDEGTIETVYTTVIWKWGTARYNTIPEPDVNYSNYSGAVLPGAVRDLAARLNADMTKHRGHDHMPALLALSHALANR